VSRSAYRYLLRHPRLAVRKASERLGLSDRTTNLAEEADRLERALADVNRRLLALGVGSPTGRPFVHLDYPHAEIRLSARVPKRSDATAKEPFTVAWLESELRGDDVVYDIGANVGAYALIAARIRGSAVRVVAFEPGAETFGVLCENIVLNGVEDQIIPFPIVLGSETELGMFRYRDLRPGAAQHDSAGTATDDAFVYGQPVLQFRLDDLVRQFTLPPPTLIKLDVDGAEAAMLRGARATLARPELREILVELPAFADEVAALLEGAGLGAVASYERPGVEYRLYRRA